MIEGPKEDCNVSLVKGEEQFVFRFNRGQELATLGAMIEMAECADTEFNWRDAVILAYELGRKRGPN